MALSRCGAVVLAITLASSDRSSLARLRALWPASDFGVLVSLTSMSGMLAGFAGQHQSGMIPSDNGDVSWTTQCSGFMQK